LIEVISYLPHAQGMVAFPMETALPFESTQVVRAGNDKNVLNAFWNQYL